MGEVREAKIINKGIPSVRCPYCGHVYGGWFLTEALKNGEFIYCDGYCDGFKGCRGQFKLTK